MSSSNERYMDARSALVDAMIEFIDASNTVGFPSHSTANSISDIVYDIDTQLHKELQHTCLPMVREFNRSKSLKYAELKKDWERALVEWEQKNMWKVLNN